MQPFLSLPPPLLHQVFVSILLSVHFCSYKEKFISLYCRLSSVLDLDALITQQALREAITDSEVATAKQRHQLILDYIQVRRMSLMFGLQPSSAAHSASSGLILSGLEL